MTVPPIPVSASLEELEAFLQSGIDASTSPSVAYGLARGDEILLVAAHGLADKERGIAADTTTPYSLASVTKPMTATAIAILADRGLLDLDAPVNEYLGDSPVVAKAGSAADATVRVVANHTSGLPLHYQFFYEDEPYRSPSRSETIRRYGKLFDAPGEHYQYSNLGYGILDTLVERISGKTYPEFMAEEVFGPLGMSRSSIGAKGAEALSYGMDGVAYPRYGFDHPGASAAFSSVEDLLRFGQSHLGFGPQILSRQMRHEMQRMTAVAGDTWGYGLGWSGNSDRLGVRTVGHTGGMSGVNTVLVLLPEHQLVIAIVVNGQSPLPFRGADNAIGSLLPEFRERLQSERGASRTDDRGAVIEVPTELQRTWVGSIETYAGDFPLKLDLVDPANATALFEGQSYPVEELKVSDGRVQGVFDGQIPTPDAARRTHRIHLNLKPRSGCLCGSAAAISTFTSDGGGAPGNRMGNAVCYWTNLG
jgi:CubicO group peptidase (beta-lactamase class C family)